MDAIPPRERALETDYQGSTFFFPGGCVSLRVLDEGGNAKSLDPALIR